MSSLPVVTARQILRALQRAGFSFSRQSASSHAIYRHPDGRFANIPMHAGDLKPGTLKSILATTGLTVDELRELL